jgi:hypothetical protein
MPVLLLAALAVAAPVPKPGPDLVKLEALYEDLVNSEARTRTRAAFALLDAPGAEKFLIGKVRPVAATQEQLTAWLKDLDSDDEKEWKPAFDNLRYYDPRIGLTIPEQIEQVKTDDGMLRLFQLYDHGGVGLTRCGDTERSRLTFTATEPVGPTLTLQTGGFSSSTRPNRLADRCPVVWDQTAVAAVLLDRLNSKASRAALDAIADGHPDALPTRTAVQLRRARFALPPVPYHDPVWPRLIRTPPADGIRWAFDLADRPDLVANLKVRLRQVLASDEERARVAAVALEHVGSGQAKQALRLLADGGSEYTLTQEAKAAVGRMR